MKELNIGMNHYTTDYLNLGVYGYEIQKEGYETQVGSVTVTNQDETVNVTLKAIPYSVTFSINNSRGESIGNADILFDGQMLDTYSVSPVYVGTYDYIISKAGYETESGSITVTNQDEVVDNFITLEDINGNTSVFEMLKK